MNRIDPRRHAEVFSPDASGYWCIDVIGAGAVGSSIVIQLAKLGLEKIRVWDPDVVEPHNLANQRYAQADIGTPKVEALARAVKDATGHDIEIHQAAVNGGESLGDVVFLAVDTMTAREAIWKGSIRRKLTTRLLIESRMGAEEGRIYTIFPVKPAHIRQYELTFYSDEVVPTSACGATTTVGPTADLTASYATWQFIRWAALEAAINSPTASDKGDQLDILDNEILFGLRPPYLLNRRFE